MGMRAHRHSALEREQRRNAALEQARRRWGIDRVLMIHGTESDRRDPAQTTGGDDDARGRDLARELQRHLRHLPVVMLHDRRLAPADWVMEHLAVGPGGVTVIAAAGELAGPLCVEQLHGVFGARSPMLRQGTGDHTELVEAVHRQVLALRRLVGNSAPVVGALCLDDDACGSLLRPLPVGGVLLAGVAAVATLSARDGTLSDTELAALVDLIHQACPPVL